MHRRAFLYSALGASVSAPAAEARIRIGFLGGSHSHGFDKAQVALESPHYEVAGVWEEDPGARARYEKAGIRPVTREQLLEDKSIQVIAVEGPVKDHAAGARLALDAGKHVHVEKPPAGNMRTFRELVALAEGKGLLMQMGYMWRYNPAINSAIEAARRGWLGEVYFVRGVMNTLIGAERRPDWAIFHGGQMFEQGSHLVDLIVRLMGRPDKVTPFLRKHGAYKDTLADNTLAVLEYPRALAVVQSSTLQPGAGPHRSLEIQGTNGTAVVRPIEPPALQIDLAKDAGPYAARTQSVPVKSYRRFVDDFEELAQAIRHRRPLSITPQEDLLVHETLMRACEM